MIRVGTTGGLFAIGERHIDFEDHEVGWLACDDDWWAIVDGHEVWRRAPDEQWSRAGSVEEYRLNCLLPASGGAYLGTSEAHLMRLENGMIEFVAGFESISGREEWFTPWGGPPDVRSLARSAEHLFANVHVGGIPRSHDGTTWVPTVDIGTDVHEVVVHNGLVLAATAVGFAVSRDEGDTWSFHTEGLHASYCRALAVCGDWALVTACVGPHGGRAALYRRPLEGDEAFEKCREGLPEWFGDNIDTRCMDSRGSSVAFVTSDGTVYVSEDCGATWHEEHTGLFSPRCLVLE